MNSQPLIRVIAAREFMARVRTRVFAITTVLTVIAIAGYILLQAFVFNKSTTSLDVGFVGPAQSIAAPVRAEAAGYGVETSTSIRTRRPLRERRMFRAVRWMPWSADPGRAPP